MEILAGKKNFSESYEHVKTVSYNGYLNITLRHNTIFNSDGRHTKLE